MARRYTYIEKEKGFVVYTVPLSAIRTPPSITGGRVAILLLPNLLKSNLQVTTYRNLL